MREKIAVGCQTSGCRYPGDVPIIRSVVIGLAVVALATAAHFVLKWMDRRGWIFYGSESSSPIGARSAMALMEFETLFNPAIEHVLEYRRHGDQWIQVTSGDDPEPEPEAESREARLGRGHEARDH
jgi:hypothetical protein